MSNQLKSKKRFFVSQGVFVAELNEFLKRELGNKGYAGVEVNPTPKRKEIIISATQPQEVLGDKGRRIRELTSAVQKRFNLDDSAVELYAKSVPDRGLSANAQAEAVKSSLLEGVAVRKACYGAIRFIMDAGATGCEIIVSGKLRAQRASAMKFREGYMLRTGHPTTYYVATAVRHVKLRQGVLGVQVKIMLPWDATGRKGPSRVIPDRVEIVNTKEGEDWSRYEPASVQ
uniref:Small ribosomal subunit protein uS3 n=1 Tax=Percolomonas cosmopolitus TaxID=63605 RepID=A0A7S1PF34_9EUKA